MLSEFISRGLAREVAEEVYLDAAKPYPDGWELDQTFGTGGELSVDNGFFAYALKPSASNSSMPSSTSVPQASDVFFPVLVRGCIRYRLFRLPAEVL